VEVNVSIRNYGFIVKGPGYDPTLDRSIIENPMFRTEVVCVSSVTDAVEIARKMAASGVEVIELCGGFGESGMNEVVAALDLDVPVGYVTFSKAENDKLVKLLGSLPCK
jgi:hypothetical protein